MKKNLLRLLVILLVSVLAISGCATEKESANNKVIYSIADDPEEFDPTLNSYSRSSIVLQQMFRGLYKIGPDSTIQPALAESYTVSDDNLTYTFKLRSGLKWSDGSALTAKDFEYSWKRVTNPDVASKTAASMNIIKNANEYFEGTATADDVGIKATDDTTLVVELVNPTPWFVSLTSTTAFMPVKQSAVEGSDNWTSDPATYISSGPFMLKEFKSKEKITLVKNPNYYNAKEVKIDGIDIMIIDAAETELAAYENNEINVADNLSAEAMNSYKDSAEYNNVDRIGIQYFDFNTVKAPFDDVRVRQAFAISIDRASLLTNILQTDEKAIFGWIPYAQPSLTDPSKSYRDIAGDIFSENIEEAKALLAEAGYPNGEGFPAVTLVVQANQAQKDTAQGLQSMWKDNLGIEVTIQTFESKIYWDELDAGNFNIARNGWTGDYLDPMANTEIFAAGGSGYENGWDNTDYDAIIANIRVETDPAVREGLFMDAEKFLAEEMPVMPVYSYGDNFLVKPNVKGVIKNYIGHISFEYVTID